MPQLVCTRRVCAQTEDLLSWQVTAEHKMFHWVGSTEQPDLLSSLQEAQCGCDTLGVPAISNQYCELD